MGKKRLMVTGASGFLGWNLCHKAINDWDITGITHKKRISIPGLNFIQLDLRVRGEAARCINRVKPHCIIHAAAVSRPDVCELYPKQSSLLNVGSTLALAEICAERNIKFVFISSDLVFNGTAAPYKESDPVSPVSAYARQKAEAEQQVLLLAPDALICRLPLMFGEGGPAAASILQPMLASMRAGRELGLFKDEYRTPLSGSEAAQGVLRMIGAASGLLHLGGPRRISRYEFGVMVQNVFGVTSAKITSIRQRDKPMQALRPGDVSLISKKANALGFRPKQLEEQLKVLANRGL